MKTRILLFSLMFLCCVSIKAHDFKVDGIYYKITDANSRSVEVTYKGESSGRIVRDDYKSSVVLIPSSVTYDGIDYAVTGIGNYAFQNCKSITKISIPNSVTSIGNCAFSLCDNLVEIDFPENISSIGGGAFFWTDWFEQQPDGPLYIGKVLYAYKGKMSENTKIAVKAGTKIIQEGVFDNCRNLVAVTLPDGLIDIGERAFCNCTFLSGIEIPNTVTTIGSSAFEGCEEIEFVRMSENIDCIGSKAFKGCTSLKSITIPGGTIGNNVFEDCKRLKTVVLGDKVTSIEHYAFARCTALTSVTIGCGVKSIKDAFIFCSSLSSVCINDIATWCGVDFYYSSGRSSNPLNYAGELYLKGEKVVDLVIPDGVTKINDFAFEGCFSIVSVTIPYSVKNIGRAAFGQCTNLKKGVLNCPVIGGFCLSNSPVSEIEIGDSVISIGENAFCNLTNLANIIIPSNIKDIGSNAFKNCTALSSVKMGRGVVSVGKNAFSGCEGITAVYLCDIAAWCNIDFSDYGSNPLARPHSKLYLNGVLLTDLVIPDGVTEIKRYSFYDYKFSKITIPSSVTRIADNAFWRFSEMHISDLSAWCNIGFEYPVTPMWYKDRLYLNGKKVSERKLQKYYSKRKK